jgi:hypothetical protein
MSAPVVAGGIVVIPTRGDIANYDLKITLEKRVFSFRFRYNSRGSFWSLSIYDDQGNAIKQGIKLVPNYFLLRTLMDDTWGIGDIAIHDPRPTPATPVLADLSGNVQLIYAGFNP